MNKKTYILFFVFYFSTKFLVSQENRIYDRNVEFSVEVKVVDKKTERPIKNAEVYINGSSLSLLLLDIKIIVKGIILVLKGGGH